jgi:hypothetical protein
MRNSPAIGGHLDTTQGFHSAFMIRYRNGNARQPIDGDAPSNEVVSGATEGL